ncbi:hypothetical protein AMP9_2590 [plant metagenome]|uniref:Lipoprotein n=1 Tax=plant metagenome TaxID=1297885 RepID=A0A484Q143_9ZZZZ
MSHAGFKQFFNRRTAMCLSGVSLVLLLGACGSSGPGSAALNPATPAPSAASSPASAPASSNINTLRLEGLGDLRIGQPVPKSSIWAERGAQASDVCRTVSSPRYPGAYAIVIDNTVQRITLGQRSSLTFDGLGIGATEQAVSAKFPALAQDLHKYESPPAKYLTSPNALPSSAGVRFEIGADGKVKLIHVGLMPVLAYVEGCA